MRHHILTSPTGDFVLRQDEHGRLRTFWLADDTKQLLANSRLDRSLMPELVSRLKAFFRGENVGFADVATPEGPDFHHRCWTACRRIPRGQTRTYGQLAVLAGGKAHAARAAGQAMRHNPLPIIVPCHRVIASSGALHGFGGSCDPASAQLSVKQTLLNLERPAAEPRKAAASSHRTRKTLLAV